MSKALILWVQLPIYLFLQMGAAVIFKWAGSASQRYWPGTFLGCVVTCFSILFLVNIYKVLPPAAALAIANGAAFIMCQLALLAVYRQSISWTGWCGIFAIFTGIAIFSFAR